MNNRSRLGGEPIHSTIVATPVGLLRLTAGQKYLYGVDFVKGEPGPEEKLPAPGENRVLDLARKELEAFFLGSLRVFSVPYRLEGTEFQKRVLQEMAKIPFGRTISYGELAARAGSPQACRAAGQVCHTNPLALVIPCHRVIGKNGSLTGFGGGLDKKAWLLEWEKQCLRESGENRGAV